MVVVITATISAKFKINIMYSNADILTAILNKFAQPIIASFAGAKIQSMPFIQAIENKVRSTGWVSGNWSLVGELSPFIEPVSGAMVQPMLKQYLSQMPDDTIPTLAHNVVDKALEQGELSLLEGYFTFEKPDLEELKRLLNINMPITSQETGYIVKTEEE